MFRKLHIQLTVFFTFVISLILIVMTGICLYIFQEDITQQSFLSFEKNIASMISYLESQPILSHRWLLDLENNYHFLISVFDGDTPLFFNSLNDSEQESRLLQLAGEQADREFEAADADFSNTSEAAESVFFTLNAGQKYYVSAAVISREDRPLRMITLYSLREEEERMKQQRIMVFAAVFAAIVLLAAFSWYFTGRAMAPVEESRRRQTQFVAAASHELRSPLTVILSSVSAMREAPLQKQQQFAGNIQEEGQRMKRLIDDMLSLANADSSHWSFCPCMTEPDTLLLDVYDRYLPRVCEKKIRLDIQLPESAVIPRKWDPDRITQVLEILLDNALSYTPPEGRILLTLCQSRDCTEYRVIDNGPGIPDDKKAAVFQRFYRADPSHHDKDHFGLGLCIAEEIVRMHKGRIYVEDAPGGGAAFIVILSGHFSARRR